MTTVKINKRKEVKFETAKDFLSAYKSSVLDAIDTEFCFDKFEIKALATDYFSYILNSDFNGHFTSVIEKKKIKEWIKYSVKRFKKQYKILKTDFDKKNDFVDERKTAMYNSKSI